LVHTSQFTASGCGFASVDWRGVHGGGAPLPPGLPAPWALGRCSLDSPAPAGASSALRGAQSPAGLQACALCTQQGARRWPLPLPLRRSGTAPLPQALRICTREHQIDERGRPAARHQQAAAAAAGRAQVGASGLGRVRWEWGEWEAGPLGEGGLQILGHARVRWPPVGEGNWTAEFFLPKTEMSS